MQLLEAKIESFNQLFLAWDEPIEFAAVHLPGYTIVKIDLPANEDKRFRIVEINGEFALNEPVVVLWQQQELIATTGAVVRTKEFDERYYYTGPLGVEYHQNETIFRLWAPTAMQVHLNFYADLEQHDAIVQSYALQPMKRGLWELTVMGDGHGLIYDYRIQFPNGIVHYTNDPYATAVTPDGRRSVVCAIEGQDIHNPQLSLKDIIVATDITQFTSDMTSGVHHRLLNHFLGMVDPNTKTPTGMSSGLQFLKDMDIHLLQLGGMVDGEQLADKWVSLNVFVPNRQYVLGDKPADAIKECRQMIQSFHRAGVNVVMECNLAHVYDAAYHPLHLTVPGYFFRYDEHGLIVDSYQLGNDLATERLMVRRYLIEIVRHWLNTYDIDGFYLEHMANIDRETMREMVRIAQLIKPDVLIYGDTDLSSVSAAQVTSMTQGAALPNIGFLNHPLRRDLLQLSAIDWQNGLEESIAVHLLGAGQLESAEGTFMSPQQVVQYVVQPHDTPLFYQFAQADTEVDLLEARVIFSLTVLLISQGRVLIPLTELVASEGVAVIHWEELARNQEFIHYFKQLIAFRERYPLFYLDNYADIHEKCQLLKYDQGLIAYSLQGERHTYLVLLNASQEAQMLSISTGVYEVLLADYEIPEFPHKIEILDDIQLPPISVTILRRKDSE